MSRIRSTSRAPSRPRCWPAARSPRSTGSNGSPSPIPNTPANALIAGEIDLIEVPPPDLFPVLQAPTRTCQLYGWNALGQPDHHALQPPASAVRQREGAPGRDVRDRRRRISCARQVGDPEIYRICNAPFICGSTLRQGVRRSADQARPREGARRCSRRAGYDGTPVVMMHQTDLQSSNQRASRSPSSSSRRAGFKVDVQSTGLADRGVAARPQGGAGARAAGTSSSPPTSTRRCRQSRRTSYVLGGGCDKAWFGWPCDPEIEKLRAAFVHETDPDEAEGAARSRSPTA